MPKLPELGNLPSYLYSGGRTDLIDISSSAGFVDPKGGTVQLSRLVDGDATTANGAGWFPQWSDGNYLEFRFPAPGTISSCTPPLGYSASPYVRVAALA